MAAVVPGRVVILDEPTNDVDPVRRRLLWSAVRALADEGNAVLLVTHNVVEAERAVDRLAILDQGRVVAQGTPAQLKSGLENELRLELSLEPGRPAPEAAPFVSRYLPNGSRALAIVPAAFAADALSWAQLLRRDGVIGEFALTPASLEDVYVELVSDRRRAGCRCLVRAPSGWRCHMRALRSYRLLVRWQALRLKGFLPLAIVVQALFAFGIVVGYPLLFPEIDQLTVLFLATGAPAITLITMGLVALPQVVAQAKLEGTLEYMRSLPVPRMVYLAADLTVWLAIVLPGVAFAVVVGVWAFGLDLSVSLAIIPATMLVAITAAAVGYAMATVLPPMIAMLLTQVLVIGVLVFSPINFPASRLPEWLQSIHARAAGAGHGRGHPWIAREHHVPADRRAVPAAGRVVPGGARPDLPDAAATRLSVPAMGRRRPLRQPLANRGVLVAALECSVGTSRGSLSWRSSSSCPHRPSSTCSRVCAHGGASSQSALSASSSGCCSPRCSGCSDQWSTPATSTKPSAVSTTAVPRRACVRACSVSCPGCDCC